MKLKRVWEESIFQSWCMKPNNELRRKCICTHCKSNKLLFTSKFTHTMSLIRMIFPLVLTNLLSKNNFFYPCMKPNKGLKYIWKIKDGNSTGTHTSESKPWCPQKTFEIHYVCNLTMLTSKKLNNSKNWAWPEFEYSLYIKMFGTSWFIIVKFEIIWI